MEHCETYDTDIDNGQVRYGRCEELRSAGRRSGMSEDERVALGLAARLAARSQLGVASRLVLGVG